jgi:hypothetical protein
MRRLVAFYDWFTDTFYAPLSLMAGAAIIIGYVAAIPLTIFHLGIALAFIEYLEDCGVTPGPLPVLFFLLMFFGPVLAVVAQAVTYSTQLRAVIFVSILFATFGYEIWMLAARMEARSGMRSGWPTSYYEERYFNSDFCAFTRAILPDDH